MVVGLQMTSKIVNRSLAPGHEATLRYTLVPQQANGLRASYTLAATLLYQESGSAVGESTSRSQPGVAQLVVLAIFD